MGLVWGLCGGVGVNRKWSKISLGVIFLELFVCFCLFVFYFFIFFIYLFIFFFFGFYLFFYFFFFFGFLEICKLAYLDNKSYKCLFFKMLDAISSITNPSFI